MNLRLFDFTIQNQEMRITQLISKIGLLSLGVLIGFQIRGEFIENSNLNKDQYSTSANDHLDSRSTRSSKNQGRNRPKGNLDSRQSPATIHKGKSGALSDRLLELHMGDFQKIMNIKKEEGIRDFLILMAVKDPEETLASVSKYPKLSKDSGLLLSIANGVALKNPIAAYELIANQRSVLSPELFNSILTSLFPVIAKSDPRFAVTLIDQITDPKDKGTAMIQLSDAWVSKDTKESLGWLNQVIDSGTSIETVELCYEKIILGSMNHDPLMAAQTVSKIESSKLLHRLVPAIGVKMAETNLTGAIEWVKSASNSDARQAGLQKILDCHAQSYPEQLFELLVGELKEDASKPHLNFSSLTKHHAEFVMQRFSSLPTASQADAAESIALSIIERDGPGPGLASWINHLPPGDVFDRATEIYALNQVTLNARNAVEFAGQVGNPQTRANLLSRLVENAKIDTIPQIHEALANVELDSEDRERLNQQITNRTANEQTLLVLPN